MQRTTIQNVHGTTFTVVNLTDAGTIQEADDSSEPPVKVSTTKYRKETAARLDRVNRVAKKLNRV